MEVATGCARVDNGAPVSPTVKDGATSGVACAAPFWAIRDGPLARVATATGFSAGDGFSAGAEFLSEFFAEVFLALSLSEAGLLALAVTAAAAGAVLLLAGAAGAG